MATNAFIVSAKRTAFGKFGGKLKNYKAAELGGIASKAALAELPKDIKVDHVVFGAVLQSDNSGAYLARHVGHHAGVNVETPALTVNRLCGSGFQSIINAVQEIRLGESHVVLTGGTENMSLSPYTLSGAFRWGTPYGINLSLEDSLASSLTDRFPEVTPMGITAENLADKYGITREQCDEYAVQSQKRWGEAQKAGAFKDEITPITIKSKKGEEVFEIDEHPRPEVDVQKMSKLPSVFRKQGGVVSAGNASGICDGAAANVVVSEEGVKRYGLKPLARILSYHVVGVEPSIMGIGPVNAIKGALERASLSIKDIDLFDVNEAFAAQWLAVQKELDLPNDKSNVFGGAIALGHPLAASGARITANLVHNLHRLDKRYAVGAACIGGGQGIAIVLERV